MKKKEKKTETKILREDFYRGAVWQRVHFLVWV